MECYADTLSEDFLMWLRNGKLTVPNRAIKQLSEQRTNSRVFAWPRHLLDPVKLLHVWVKRMILPQLRISCGRIYLGKWELTACIRVPFSPQFAPEKLVVSFWHFAHSTFNGTTIEQHGMKQSVLH